MHRNVWLPKIMHAAELHACTAVARGDGRGRNTHTNTDTTFLHSSMQSHHHQQWYGGRGELGGQKKQHNKCSYAAKYYDKRRSITSCGIFVSDKILHIRVHDVFMAIECHARVECLIWGLGRPALLYHKGCKEQDCMHTSVIMHDGRRPNCSIPRCCSQQQLHSIRGCAAGNYVAILIRGTGERSRSFAMR